VSNESPDARATGRKRQGGADVAVPRIFDGVAFIAFERDRSGYRRYVTVGIRD
jgi:hypothetical protein